MATDGSGDIYVAGNFSEYNGTSTIGLARLNNDGSFDTGFVVDTSVFHFQEEHSSSLHLMAVVTSMFMSPISITRMSYA